MLKHSLVAVVVLSSLLNFACTDEKKTIQEPIQATAETDEHSFKVDEKTGKLEFKADIVYFGFDDASLTPDGMARLDAIAAHMQKEAGLKITIEGHCDDRGSIEYNLALGQRRSDAVRAYLKTIGLPEDRLQAVSFGEEKPATAGQGEDFWAKNRRAEFAFLQ
ncbi:MAG: OmpA family protein [Oligoflexus sp.]|jgi:peptidoglycan-associated lipoprotein